MRLHTLKLAAAFLALALCAEVPQAATGNDFALVCLPIKVEHEGIEFQTEYSSREMNVACQYFVEGVVGGRDRTRDTALSEFLASFSSKSAPARQFSEFARAMCAFNMPDGVTYEQMTEIFRRYLKNHPERRHEDAAALVLESLAEAFPCEAKP